MLAADVASPPTLTVALHTMVVPSILEPPELGLLLESVFSLIHEILGSREGWHTPSFPPNSGRMHLWPLLMDQAAN